MDIEQAPDASEDDASPVKKHKPARQESPVWDIELEDGQLPSGAASGVSVRSEEGTRLGGTVLLDTGAFTAKWVAPGKPRTPTESDFATPAVEPSMAHESGASSIAPSHSASQVASRQDEVGAPGQMRSETFSRFFAVPISITRSPKPQPVPARDAPQSIVSQLPLHPRSPVNPQLHASDDTGGVGSPNYEHLADRWRSNTSDNLVVTEQQIAMVPESHGYMRVSSPDVLADTPMSSVLHPIARSSSPGLPTGPRSPASPGRLDPDLDGVVPLDSAYTPHHHAAISDQDLPQADWTVHPLDTFHTDDVPTFLSNFDRHGDYLIAGAYTYMREEDEMNEMAVEDPTCFANSYTMEDHVPDFARSSPMIPPFEHEAIEYHHDSAYWEYTQHVGADDELCGYLHPVAVAVDAAPRTSYLAVDVGDVAAEDDLRWLADDAEDGGMEHGHSFYAGDPDDDYVASETGFASPGVALAVGLETDDALESEADEDPSVLGALPRFSQGRALLMGVAETGNARDYYNGVSSIEEDVAKSLRGHWLPQRSTLR